jgi:hypothetical protein
MAKKLTMFALRLALLNLVSIFIMGIMITISNNSIFQWVVTALITFALMYIVWRDSENVGQRDYHCDKIINRRMAEENYSPQGREGSTFRKGFGFAGGFLAQAPAFILLVISGFQDRQSVSNGTNAVFYTLMPVTRAWYLTYAGVVTYADNFFTAIHAQYFLPVVMFAFVALFSIVAGVAYLNGPAVDRRIETMIERNKAKKQKLVQDEWKAEAKRKARQNKPAYKK